MVFRMVRCWWKCLLLKILPVLFPQLSSAFTGTEYSLDSEYSGQQFFDEWDFYTGRDPTGGFVTYYSRSSSQLTGLINASANSPAYMGVNYVDTLPFNNLTGRGDGAGRPSVRIASKKSWTHGLFIGDFAHTPAGICGTWPAFWTLGPNWPYTGEIDVMEGVNQNTNNIMSLHTNETCLITGDATTMTGTLENTNCAYYPDYNVGCGVQDISRDSYGAGFNEAGGGVYAMQWTSEYINIWQWLRSNIPQDIQDRIPNPSSWGLPAASLAVGDCSVDQHFQQHKIIFDTTFCGEYAGVPSVWNTTDVNSCAAKTNLATCDNFVANNPDAFKDAYWSVNYVRVYQLVDPQNNSSIPSPYIASEQLLATFLEPTTTSSAVPTPSGALCPQYNFTIISDGSFAYEIACDYDPPGPDLIGDPYSGFHATSLEDCIRGCTYLNVNNGTDRCGGVSHYEAINFCYFKKFIDGPPNYRPGYNEIRLIYYGYPQITDDPRSQESTNTVSFVETIPEPQTYQATTTTKTSLTESTSSRFTTTTLGTPVGIPGQGISSTTSETALGNGTASLGTIDTMFSSFPDRTTIVSQTVPFTFQPATSGQVSTSPSSTAILTGITYPGQGVNTTSVGQVSVADSSVFELSTTETSAPASMTIRHSLTSSLQLSTSTAEASASQTLTVVNGFVYAGCFGIPGAIPGVEQSAISSNMTVELCTSTCRNDSAYYAGMYGQSCFCGLREDIYEQLQEYSDGSCSLICPGADQETCGGNIGIQNGESSSSGAENTSQTANAIQKRASDCIFGNTDLHLGKRQTSLVLISLYNNTLLLSSEAGQSILLNVVSESSTTSTTIIQSESDLSSRPVTSSASDGVTNSGYQSTTTITYQLTSHRPDSVSYDVTATFTATALTTVFVGVCDTCPGGLTTCTTTATMHVCGAVAQSNAAQLRPTIPMTVTEKDCLCGKGGSSSRITVTVPCTESLQTSSLQTLSQGSLPTESNQNILPSTAMTGYNAPLSTNKETPSTNSAVSESSNLQTPSQHDTSAGLQNAAKGDLTATGQQVLASSTELADGISFTGSSTISRITMNSVAASGLLQTQQSLNETAPVAPFTGEAAAQHGGVSTLVLMMLLMFLIEDVIP